MRRALRSRRGPRRREGDGTRGPRSGGSSPGRPGAASARGGRSSGHGTRGRRSGPRCPRARQDAADDLRPAAAVPDEEIPRPVVGARPVEDRLRLPLELHLVLGVGEELVQCPPPGGRGSGGTATRLGIVLRPPRQIPYRPSRRQRALSLARSRQSSSPLSHHGSPPFLVPAGDQRLPWILAPGSSLRPLVLLPLLRLWAASAGRGFLVVPLDELRILAAASLRPCCSGGPRAGVPGCGPGPPGRCPGPPDAVSRRPSIRSRFRSMTQPVPVTLKFSVSSVQPASFIISSSFSCSPSAISSCPPSSGGASRRRRATRRRPCCSAAR